MTRLDSLSPDLVKTLRDASVKKQREAALTAAESAISKVQLKHPIVEKALGKLRLAGVLAENERAELDALAASLDKEYFDLQDAAEKGQTGIDDYKRMFSQARAVAALSFAGREEPFEAATEAVYESAASSDENEEILLLIDSLLK